MNPGERIETILTYCKLNQHTLAKKIGYNNGSIFMHIKSGRNGISVNLALKITEAYPEINYNWLLTGNGEMLNGETEKPTNELLQRIEFLEEHVKGLNARIVLLEQRVDAEITNPNKATMEA